MEAKTFDLNVQIRWTGTRWEAKVGDEEGEFASVSGGGDLYPVLNSLIPYMASLTETGPFDTAVRWSIDHGR